MQICVCLAAYTFNFYFQVKGHYSLVQKNIMITKSKLITDP